MRMITVLDTLRFGQNVRLRLSDDQAKTRMHNLVKVKGEKDLYDTSAEVCFKRGEEIGYAGTLNRAMAEKVLVEGNPVEGSTLAAKAATAAKVAKPEARVAKP